jgi:ABC-2 type transport system ATP-binding protein
MLEVNDLTKRYASIPAVQNLTFCLRPGEVLGCVGPNGSGKSTTVKMLTGLLKPTRGEVLFDGHPIAADLVGYRRHVGYMPEEPNLYPYLTGREYLEMVGTLRAIPPRQLEQRVDALLELFSLHPYRHASMASYSKGMRQRSLLIAAIMDSPELLILDEPLSGLDVGSVLIFRALVKALAAKGCSVFYCSHVLEVVEKLCSHLLILSRGKAIACDSAARLGQSTGGASLEDTFSNLVHEVDAERVTRDILDVLSAS